MRNDDKELAGRYVGKIAYHPASRKPIKEAVEELDPLKVLLSLAPEDTSVFLEGAEVNRSPVVRWKTGAQNGFVTFTKGQYVVRDENFDPLPGIKTPYAAYTGAMEAFVYLTNLGGNE